MVVYNTVKTESDFYPRPPGGGRLYKLRQIGVDVEFLSTPSGWRATVFGICPHLSNFISIHALRVEGDLVEHCSIYLLMISIHALRVEGDIS